MDTKALQLTSRFSLPPNSLGYCGKDSAPAKFIKCVTTCGCAGVSKELGKFIVLHPYLKTLAKITGTPKYSYKNIEAYWIGSSELKKAKPEHYKLLLKYFIEQGVPTWFVEELKQRPPKRFIPHHLFQVLHVGVGRASGSVPYNLETINNCMVRWGEVKSIDNKTNELKIELNSLKEIGGKTGEAGVNYKLVKNTEKYGYRNDFLPKVKVGSMVTVHWKQVVKELTAIETKNLEFWTNEILAAL